MSTTQVTHHVTQYPKYVRYEVRWATGRLGFKPIVEKQEIVLRRKCPTKLVLVYESEYQSTYSRTYSEIVLLALIEDEDEEKKVHEKLMELLEDDPPAIEQLLTEDIIKHVSCMLEHDVRKINVEEDYDYYKRITIILK